jgi:acetoin utilization protein AcuB
MSADVISVSPDTTLPEAHQVMTQRHVRRLPVVENGRLVGIITRGDVREASPSGATTLSIWEMNYLLARLAVREIMTPNPATISPDDTIAQAARMMANRKISGLPVVDQDGRLVGIITESDIFRLVAQQWEEG